MMKLPRPYRITKAGEFYRVRKRGKSIAGGYLILATLEDSGLEHFKSGIITSKKVGNAVERNRVRRRIRSIIREVGEEISGERLLVTVARARATGATFEKLRREWYWLAKKAGVLDAGCRPWAAGPRPENGRGE